MARSRGRVDGGLAGRPRRLPLLDRGAAMAADPLLRGRHVDQRRPAVLQVLLRGGATGLRHAAAAGRQLAAGQRTDPHRPRPRTAGRDPTSSADGRGDGEHGRPAGAGDRAVHGAGRGAFRPSTGQRARLAGAGHGQAARPRRRGLEPRRARSRGSRGGDPTVLRRAGPLRRLCAGPGQPRHGHHRRRPGRPQPARPAAAAARARGLRRAREPDQRNLEGRPAQQAVSGHRAARPVPHPRGDLGGGARRPGRRGGAAGDRGRPSRGQGAPDGPGGRRPPRHRPPPSRHPRAKRRSPRPRRSMTMGSALFLVWLPVPTDGSPPDWAAAHAAADQLTTRQLNEELLDALDLLLADPEEDEATYDARVLAAAQHHLHTRLEELQEAYGDGGTDMSGELAYLHVFGRRLLITGGSSWGDPPTEIFTALDELTEFPTIVAALGGNTRPVPAQASTPSIEPGQVLDIDGFGRRVVGPAGELAEAPADQPLMATAEIGSVVYLLGHGYYLVELDCDLQAEGDGDFPALTLLSRGD